jgi:thioredoxin-related protein
MTLWDDDQKKFAKSVHKNSDSTASLQPRPNIYDESSNGAEQIADALDIARKEHKHILLQFGANYCVPCHKLHELFQTNTNIAEELKKHYVVVMIDMNKGHNKDIVTKYDPIRSGIPAIAVLDSEGKQLTIQDTGTPQDADNHSPEKILAFLKEWSPPSQ